MKLFTMDNPKRNVFRVSVEYRRPLRQIQFALNESLTD